MNNFINFGEKFGGLGGLCQNLNLQKITADNSNRLMETDSRKIEDAILHIKRVDDPESINGKWTPADAGGEEREDMTSIRSAAADLVSSLNFCR